LKIIEFSNQERDITADYLHNSTEFYFKAKKTLTMIDPMP